MLLDGKFGSVYGQMEEIMTSKKHKQLSKEIEKIAKKAAKSEADAQELLIKAGIYTKSGNLKKAYS